jgi:peroxiredoxin
MTAAANPARKLLEGRVLYPILAVLVLGVVLALQYWPALARNAPDFTLPVVTADGAAHGDRMRLADQRGKVVLLDFWATWCRPCRMSTPALVHLFARYRQRGLVVIGINVDDGGPEIVPEFMRRFAIDYPVLYDEGRTQSAYNVRALPTAVLIDRQGRIRRVHQGVASEEDLADQIEGLL